MSNARRLLILAITSACALASAAPARAGVYEALSELAFTHKEKRCDPVPRSAALAAATGCAEEPATLSPELRRQLDFPDEYLEARFFEKARAELARQHACSAGKIEALLRDPAAAETPPADVEAQEALVKDFAEKLPRLREIVRVARERRREINAAWQPGTDPSLESASNPETVARRRVNLAGLAELREMDAAYDTLRASLPLSQFGEVGQFIDAASGRALAGQNDLAGNALAGVSEHSPLDPVSLRARLKPLLTRLRDDLRVQGSALDPALPLPRIVREDIVKDHDLLTSLLAHLGDGDGDIGEPGREALECRLESRYGRGTEHREDLTTWAFLGSFITLKGRPAATAAKAMAPVRRAAAAAIRGASGALGRVGLSGVRIPVNGRALLIAFRGGLLTLDGVNQAQRYCLGSPVSHYRAQDPQAATTQPARHWWGKTKEADPREAGAGEGCDGRQFMDELKGTNCLLAGAMFLNDVNAAREPAGVAKTLLQKLDRKALPTSRATSWGIWFSDPEQVLPTGLRETVKHLRESDAEGEGKAD